MPRPPTSPSPPLPSLPYTTGSFDYPPAIPTLPALPALPRVSLANFQRDALPPVASHNFDQRQFEPQNVTMHPRTAGRSTRSSRRGSLHRIFGPSRASNVVDNLPNSPSAANPNRPRATPSERYLRRSQARIREQRAAAMDATTDLPHSISDVPINNPYTIFNPNVRPRSPTVLVSSECRSKRRKLDHEAPETPTYTCFKYGHKGQVVSGRLRMQIVECDGGEHRKDNPPGLYKVENVLRNDTSVYCSESSRCNLLLKHIGEAAFALEKVVIRAPDRGFTAPVQEGLVFVSMFADDLISGTAAYNLQYAAARSRSPALSSDGEDNEQSSHREALESSSIWEQSRQNVFDDVEERIENLRLRSGRFNTGTASLISSLRSDSDRRRVMRRMVEHEEDSDGDNCDESYRGVVGISAPTPPPFTVTTASEEEESDSNGEQPSAAIMADRLRRESRWRPESDDEGDGTTRIEPLQRAPALDYINYSEWRERRERYIEPIRASRVGLPSRIELSDSVSDPESLIPPHARFFIAKNKNKITIKFHPAISGKHILLKFWSPKHDGNIDIESLQFYGYSGPRFFPATKPR